MSATVVFLCGFAVGVVATCAAVGAFLVLCAAYDTIAMEREFRGGGPCHRNTNSTGEAGNDQHR